MYSIAFNGFNYSVNKIVYGEKENSVTELGQFDTYSEAKKFVKSQEK